MISKAVSEDVNMETPRHRSQFPSDNSSRESSTHSNASSVPYHVRMEAQSNDPTWAEQMAIVLCQSQCRGQQL